MTRQRADDELVAPKHPVLTYLGFFFISALLVFPGAITSLVLVLGNQGASEAGPHQGLILLQLALAFLGLIYLWFAGFFYIKRDRLPASSILLPAALVLFVSIWSGGREIALGLNYIDQAAPENQLAYAFRCIGLLAVNVITGVLLTSFFCLATAMLAAFRSLARKRRKGTSRVGLLIVLFGMVAGIGGPLFVYGFDAVRGEWVGVVGFVASAAALFVGLGSIGATSNTRDGANQLLLVVSALGAVSLTWLAMFLASLYSLGDIDFLPFEDRLRQLARGQLMAREARVLGVTGVLVILGVCWSALAGSRAHVVAAARRFRWSAGLVAVLLLGCLVMAYRIMSIQEEVFRVASLGDGTHIARQMASESESFQLARSKSTTVLGRVQLTVLLEGGGVRVDGEVVPDTHRLSAKGPAGYRLRGVLEAALSRWSSRQDGETAELLARHKTVARVPWHRDGVTLAVDRRVPFSSFFETSQVLRSLGVSRASVLVGRPTLFREHPRSVVQLLGPLVGPWPWDYSTIDISLHPFRYQIRPDPEEDFLDLRIIVTGRGIYIHAAGGVLPEGCSVETDESGRRIPTIEYQPELCGGLPHDGSPGPRACGYNMERLRECFLRIKDEYPDERAIVIDGSRDVSFGVIVEAMDAARGGEFENTFPLIGLPWLEARQPRMGHR